MPVSAFTAEIRAQESPGGSCIGRMQHNICGADIIPWRMPVSAFTAEIRAQESPGGAASGRCSIISAEWILYA